MVSAALMMVHQPPGTIFLTCFCDSESALAAMMTGAGMVYCVFRWQVGNSYCLFYRGLVLSE